MSPLSRRGIGPFPVLESPPALWEVPLLLQDLRQTDADAERDGWTDGRTDAETKSGETKS